VPISIGLAAPTRAGADPHEFVAPAVLIEETDAQGQVSFDLIPSADLQGSPRYIVYDHDTELGRFEMPAEAAVLGALAFSSPTGP